ncbi:26581_t:CDS:2, partial [Dentiscutata erythropus]
LKNNSKSRRHLWNFIKQNWDLIQQRYIHSLQLFGLIIKSVDAFSTLDDIRDIEEFFKDKNIKEIERPLQQSLENIRVRAAWLSRDKKDLIRRYATTAFNNSLNQVYIVSAVRTPIGCFNGALKKLTAAELGAIAAKGAIEKAGLKPEQIEEVYFGNVLQANQGQSPARCPTTTEATTINKVCASGMKATILAAQNLAIGDRSIMIAGGMESMSNVPFYVPRNVTYGNQELSDGIIKDGLMDGNCAENTAKKFGISREAQDQHAIESYKRAAEAWKNGVFKEEIVPVIINDRKKQVVIDEDEEYKNVKFEKIPELRPVFQKD